jgi:putative nucleotidyltransferase with HDIG domain
MVAGTAWWESGLRLPAALALIGTALVTVPGDRVVPWRGDWHGLVAVGVLWTCLFMLRGSGLLARFVWPFLALLIGSATLSGILSGVVPTFVLLPLLATLPLYPLEGLVFLAVGTGAIIQQHWSLLGALPWEITASSILVASALLRQLASVRRRADTLLTDCVRAVTSPDDADALHLLQRVSAAGDVALLRGEPQPLGVTVVERPFIWLHGEHLRQETALVAQGMVELPAAFPRQRAAALDLPGTPGSKLFIAGASQDDDSLLLSLARLVGLREAQRWTAERLRSADYSALESLVQALDARDPYTRGHSERVARYAMAIGEELGLSADLIDALQRGGMLHDIGKIGVPEHILLKPTQLTADEYAIMQRHVKIGVQIIDSINRSSSVLDVVSGHHEHHNGTGYPRRLKGEQIPLLARIAHVADSFEAMTSARSYNQPRALRDGVAELRRCSGTEFHPDIVETFAAVLQRGSSRCGPIVV